MFLEWISWIIIEIQYEPLYLLILFPIIFIILWGVMTFGRKERNKVIKNNQPEKMKDPAKKIFLVRFNAVFLGLIILSMIGLFFYNAFSR